ncbi:hypothetical protein [Hyalangium minutum]|uniref:Uncharacterized protein n=1 Tax=Hyalangium minutum TaxID=394096 RepID=A0A085WIV6_9BACT|nr:hypothetical protein [Hyalangium minutum]KFE67619.1 hypothetical protein DB31_8102 [Hyalangium minutum]
MAALLPPDNALRVQLEGRWERIEQAHARYAALARQLGSWGWRNQLRDAPELLKAVREQEPGLDEVLEYVERRAQLEHWPQGHPGPAALQRLRAQRARLLAQGRKRLAQWGLPAGASFTEVLSGLESKALAPLPDPPGEAEPVLAEGRSWFPRSRFWLTPERLVWILSGDAPQQLPLKNLLPGSISLLPAGLGVRVEGEAHVTLPGVRRPRALVALLKLYSWKRRGPEGMARERVTRRAFLDELGTGREQDRVWGICVFRPGYLAFLPERQPTLGDRLRYLVGAASPTVPAELKRLEAWVKQLRKLPEEEFDAHLQELLKACGGHLWPSRVLHRARNIGGQGPRILVRRRSVVAIPEARPEFVEQFFQMHWPNAWKVVRPSWWRRHAASLGLISINVLVWSSFLFGGLPREDAMAFWYAGQVPWVLAFMRYVRVKGYHPLLGLVTLAPCPGWLILTFLSDKNSPRE